MTTGQRMKARRKELGLSAEYVAGQLNVSPATIYRYENGGIDKVPGDILEPLSKVLQTTPAYLMGWTEPVLGDITKADIALSNALKTIVDICDSYEDRGNGRIYFANEAGGHGFYNLNLFSCKSLDVMLQMDDIFSNFDKIAQDEGQIPLARKIMHILASGDSKDKKDKDTLTRLFNDYEDGFERSMKTTAEE